MEAKSFLGEWTHDWFCAVISRLERVFKGRCYEKDSGTGGDTVSCPVGLFR